MNYTYQQTAEITKANNKNYNCAVILSFANTDEATTANLKVANMMLLVGNLITYVNDGTGTGKYNDTLTEQASSSSSNTGTYIDLTITYQRLEGTTLFAAPYTTMLSIKNIVVAQNLNNMKNEIWSALGAKLQNPADASTTNFVISNIVGKYHD